MKIVQFITELRPAGAERIVVNLSKELQKRGHELIVLSLKSLPAYSNLVEELNQVQIPVISLEMSKIAVWRMFQFRKVMKTLKPDIVHAHLIHANIISRWMSTKRSYKLINTVHIAEKRSGKGWHFWLDRLTFSLCDQQTCVSNAVRNFHAEKIGVSKETMPVIYNGIEHPKPLTNEEHDHLRKEWGMATCSCVVGSIGRLDYQKGYDIFLRTVNTFGDSIPPGERWGIVIIGEGPMRNELEQLGKKLDANFRVCFPGFRPDAARCIGAFDLFVMPSRYEGFGLTLIEAMSLGIPVLASDVDSLPEIMGNYPHGETIHFNVNNAQSIYQKICHLRQHSAREPWLAFSVDSMVDAYEALYAKATEP